MSECVLKTWQQKYEMQPTIMQHTLNGEYIHAAFISWLCYGKFSKHI